jgi:hypothetical protein
VAACAKRLFDRRGLAGRRLDAQRITPQRANGKQQEGGALGHWGGKKAVSAACVGGVDPAGKAKQRAGHVKRGVAAVIE